MAVKVIEIVTCDVCGGNAAESHPDVMFKWHGVEYQIDLCDDHYEAMDFVMKGIVQQARRIEVRDAERRRLKLLAKTKPERLRKLNGSRGAR